MGNPMSGNEELGSTSHILSNGSNLSSFSGARWNDNILLFFVALGFGVLFCNLWVIIGIKYCYRYSNVNRSNTIEIRRITSQNQPCQKKLMTQGEADRQFPSILYKIWRSEHKHQKRFPHKMTSPESDEKITENASKDREFIDVAKNSDEHAIQQEKSHDPNIFCSKNFTEENIDSNDQEPSSAEFYSCMPATSNENVPYEENNDVNIYIPDEEQNKHEDEYVTENKHKKVVSVESPDDSDDTCAICLDIFKDEDQVRVLTCGHVYHSSCIVPWFTTKRAMCPLCKYDFYIPKTPTNTDMGDINRNIESLPEAQIYDRLHHPYIAYFSTFQPQHFQQYRFSSNNYQNNFYRETDVRSSLPRRVSGIPSSRRNLRTLFRRNHSYI